MCDYFTAERFSVENANRGIGEQEKGGKGERE
jgi:hypothetical protein